MPQEVRLARNRSEIFYTATVLPMIVCGRGLDGVRNLLRAAGASQAAAASGPIQFVTEYDHAKARHAVPGDWDTEVETPATPDVVILVAGDRPTLVGIEAKMFHRPSPSAIAEQVEQQRVVLRGIAHDLPGEIEIVQALLVPPSFPPLTGPGFDRVTVFTWADLLDQYPDTDPYWRDVLDGALKEYDKMKSSSVKIFDAKCAGLDIMQANHGYRWVGLKGGAKGLEALVAEANGHQKALSRTYEVRYDEPPTKNPNWLRIDTFREILAHSSGARSTAAE